MPLRQDHLLGSYQHGRQGFWSKHLVLVAIGSRYKEDTWHDFTIESILVGLRSLAGAVTPTCAGLH